MGQIQILLGLLEDVEEVLRTCLLWVLLNDVPLVSDRNGIGNWSNHSSLDLAIADHLHWSVLALVWNHEEHWGLYLLHRIVSSKHQRTLLLKLWHVLNLHTVGLIHVLNKWV